MERLIVFMILSVPIIIISWRTLFHVKSHGFYRFLAWEGILWLLVSNITFWFTHPLGWNQLISWTLLIIAGVFVITGVVTMKRKGRPSKTRSDQTLYAFEKTTRLVDTGIFHYIRHPLYSSLLFLCWGAFFKQMNFELFIVSVATSIFLYFTALSDEKECIKTFGNDYTEYKKRTKRFIPFII